MKPRILSPLLVILASSTLIAGPITASKAPAKRPNIIVIVSDDQGYADASFQGSKDILTPNLDALAKSGVRCTRGYVTAPVCSPSRAGLMTGRYQEKFGHHNNIVVEAANPVAHVPSDETLLPQVLAKAGYHTAMVGKWHLGQQDGCRPYERGFQEFFGIITGGHDYFVNHPDERAVGDAQYKARIERNGPTGEAVPGYLTDAFGDDAVRIIHECHEKRPEQPLFLYLAFNAPHTPTQAPKPLVDSMPSTLEGKDRRTYAAQIVAMDTAVGKVRAALRETGMEKDTFIVFFSDNGGANHPYYDNTPLRDYKGTLYEGGIRVPFFAVYPERIAAGSVCDRPVSSLDVFATACALAGTKPETAHPLDSVDMLPVLEGKTQQATHGALYWEFPGFGAAVADGDLKLVVPKKGAPQLFDLAADMGEKNDLAAQKPDEVARLSALLAKWQAQTVKPLWGAGSQAKASASETPKSAPARGDLAGEEENPSKAEPVPPGINPGEAAQWRMVWHDEFDDDVLDETKWSYRYLGPRENSVITKDCISLDGRGLLHVWVKDKDGVLQNGMIGTQGKFEATFGIMAARIKFPSQQGQHGSLWMQPGKREKGATDAAGGGAEVDVVEWFGAYRKDSATASNVYWGTTEDPKKNRVGHMVDLKDVLKPDELISEDFHVFSVEWSPSGYVFRIDGHETMRVTEGISHQPQYLILSLLTAEWEAGRLDRSKLPNSMDVDWVRVWQKADNAQTAIR